MDSAKTGYNAEEIPFLSGGNHYFILNTVVFIRLQFMPAEYFKNTIGKTITYIQPTITLNA